MKKTMKKAGFTLIELLVVIVILGILSTISVGTFRSYFAKARDAERVSTVQNLAMMIKVDSGGAGDCTVYNYTGDDLCAGASTERLGTLLLDNDYSIPMAKNGLNYYYVFFKGSTEGDNDFFVAVGAEEENAQNGTTVAAPFSIFVDGTNLGIAIAPNCAWTDGVLEDCPVGGVILPLTAGSASPGCTTACASCNSYFECTQIGPSCSFTTTPSFECSS